MRKLFILGSCVVSLVLLIAAAGYTADFVSEDIGTTDVGSTDAVGGKWTIEAGGKDIWDAADHFRFIYQEVSGNFDISFRAISIEQTNNWAKVGPMARQSNAPESTYVFMLTRAQDGNRYFQERMTEAANATGDGGELTDAAGFPVWLRITREGDVFTGYTSVNGSDWTDLGVTTLVMTDPVLVGVAVTSHSAGTITTAEIDSLQTSFGGTAVDVSGKLTTTWGDLKFR